MLKQFCNFQFIRKIKFYNEPANFTFFLRMVQYCAFTMAFIRKSACEKNFVIVNNSFYEDILTDFFTELVLTVSETYCERSLLFENIQTLPFPS